jgi:hypothetical protein
MTNDLMLAILALDSYDRGYDAQKIVARMECSEIRETTGR